MGVAKVACDFKLVTQETKVIKVNLSVSSRFYTHKIIFLSYYLLLTARKMEWLLNSALVLTSPNLSLSGNTEALLSDQHSLNLRREDTKQNRTSLV